MEKSFVKNEIENGIPGLIILSHGPLAMALKETGKMIFGDAKNVVAFSLQYGDDVSEYAEAFIDAIDSFDAGCLIIVDIIGGTPFNQLLLHAKRNDKKYNIISGANLPLLITALTLRNIYLNDVEGWKKAISSEMNEFIKDVSDYC